MSGINKKLETIEKVQERLAVKKALLVEEGLKSKSPNDILTAQRVLQGIEHRKEGNKKSFVIDPLDFNNSFGYKDKPYSLSYGTLKAMAKTPIINAIIKTRKNQIADFAEPQSDKYSTGFVIKKKRRPGEEEVENTPEDWAEIERIQEFIMNCGVNNSWENDDFETFIRKIVDDSLTYDQMTFEVVRDNRGMPYEFFATDGSTFRVADSYDDDTYEGTEKEQVKGYYPSYVQVYQGAVVNDFYPWELCFGVRNPTTSIFNVGYGISELEELITTVTAMLWADEYNKRFFSQGSAPKGLLRVKGNVSEKQLDAFRQEWLSMITGVQQSWKTPIVDADIDWIDLQKNNRDMEYSAWSEYLIKVACSIFSIDPNEIGFNISNSAGSNNMFESNNEQKLKHSKDKGLYPILKFIQRKLNKYIVGQLNDRFEFAFVGLNGMTITEELEVETKKLGNFQTVNEIRAKYNLKEIEGGDVILNPTYTQSQMANQMAEQQGVGMGVNPFTGEMDGDDENPFTAGLDNLDEDDNPFLKSFKDNLKK